MAAIGPLADYSEMVSQVFWMVSDDSTPRSVL